jgi:hypothetical protein
MQQSTTIQKNPLLSNASNYQLLRKTGLEYIEQLGAGIWTDYNIHDPGITFLEMLCYAITDLGYRSSLNIKDILAEPLTKIPKDPPERQGFFTAREILTINPWTNTDFRKLLIDIDGIKNAWLHCKECPCNDLLLYAKCSTSQLQYQPTEHAIVIKGLYDVLVEFEQEDGTADLNSGKVKYNFSFATADGFSTAMIEMRLPSWQVLENNNNTYKDLQNPKSEIKTVAVQFISGNKNDNIDVPVSELANVLRRPVYATIDITYKPDKDLDTVQALTFTDVPMSIWFKSDANRKMLSLTDIKQAIADASPTGIFARYLHSIHKANQIIAHTSYTLHNHRNLGEDYCSIKAVQVQDIGICADMDVEPFVDIEAVLAAAYYRIDQYLSPDIKFYSLKELMDAGVPVDEIFDGPKLDNGFIDNLQLESTGLKTFIYTSDIINLLMDIPGVKNIRNFVITKYDTAGNLINSEKWVMEINYNSQPRLYLEASKVLVFKNGLPFLPDKLELSDTLLVIKGEQAQPKYAVADNDLSVPTGTYFELNSYYPAQYALPLTYGIGAAGLPASASAQRQAQAKQLKAYLLFYEQLLINYVEQLANVKELFAIDTGVTKTYFSKIITEEHIAGTAEIFNGLDANQLHGLAETPELFYDRRNRFLNHLLARFAENFNDYALMLYAYADTKAVADPKLVNDKVNFLQAFPFISANRARGINIKQPAQVCSSQNVAGLQVRIQRLLGIDAFGGHITWQQEYGADGILLARRWCLKSEDGELLLCGSTNYINQNPTLAAQKAQAEIAVVKKYIADETRYLLTEETQWLVNLTNTANEVLATAKQAFASKAAAEMAVAAIIAFAEKLLLADKVFVVEHLLLRPRNSPSLPNFANGDPLLTICIPGNCALCGDEDPYSFRLTVVLSGETGIANSGIAFRKFAEKTIRTEVPAHLAVKICWVSNVQLQAFEQVYCAWLTELAKPEPDAILLHQKLTALLLVFEQLKSVYPEARLHDCVDGDDSNRVFLDNTII